MTCKEYLSEVEFDSRDVDDVLRVLKEVLETDKLESTEQRLYCFGWILSKNKEEYIRELSNDVKKYRKQRNLFQMELRVLNEKFIKYQKYGTLTPKNKKKLIVKKKV